MTDDDPDPTADFPEVAREGRPNFEPEEARFFSRGLRALNDAAIPYLVAGAFAKHAYTGVWRNTKDLDIFLKPEELKRALDTLAGLGLRTSIEFHHWLAKAHQEPYVIDLIFGSGHGQLRIDDSWFENSRPGRIAGAPTRLIPIEELVVSKMYVSERYRADTADVLHLIHGAQGQINWQRILDLLGDSRDLLLPYLLLFAYVYPGHADYLPVELVDQLYREARRKIERPDGASRFRGTLLDPFSYIVDVEDWGYDDPRRLEPLVDEEGNLL
jgi:hypothetical protein